MKRKYMSAGVTNEGIITMQWRVAFNRRDIVSEWVLETQDAEPKDDVELMRQLRYE